MTRCAAPLCGQWTVEVVDSVTGFVIHTLDDTSAWLFQFTKRENAPSDFQLTLNLDARCCGLTLIPWRHQIKAYRDGVHCMTWFYTSRVPVIQDGTRQVVLSGVSAMWLALRRLWFSAHTETNIETTEVFTRLLDEADAVDPLGLFREAVPVGQTITYAGAVGDPLAEVWAQLSAGTLEWTEYGLGDGSQVVRYGETTYDSGLTIDGSWWDSPLEPSQDGQAVASVVRVVSTVTTEPEEGEETGSEETTIVGWYPPLQANGKPPLGSGETFLPVTRIVEGIGTQAEADAVAKRVWEKTQSPDFIDDQANTLTRDAAGFCPCVVHPGAVLSANLDSDCSTFFDSLRLTELTVAVDSGREVEVSPTLVAGQA